MGGAKGRAEQGFRRKETTSHTQKWEPVCPNLRRVQEIARVRKEERFTSLAHYLTVEALGRAFQRIDPRKAPGIDGVTKKEYGRELEANLRELHERLKSGKYLASPVKRVWIDKPDGGKRPLGLPTIEDKIVQGAVVEILNCIYEEDFMGFSYGFRPGRSQHQALQALQTALQKGQVNWVLDADLSKFFDSIDHKELMAVLERRVADRSLLRLIGKWLSAGFVEEDGRRVRPKVGTPQGGVISPLLANLFLHYALDRFIHKWRRTKARGEVYMVRFADDFVIGCEREEDALDLIEVLDEQLSRYKLTLNRDKTHLVRFGPGWDGRGGPGSGSFDFLGFTHISGRDRRGRYLVKRKTSRKRFRRAVKAMSGWCRKNRHRPLEWQWRELKRKMAGHYEYYGIRGNYEALARYRQVVWKAWFHSLRRRSQKTNLKRLYRLTSDVFTLPNPKITHSEGWLLVNPGYLLGRAGCGNAARPVL